MPHGPRLRLGLALVIILALALAPAALAQIARGNIYGKVVDASGAVLPGVSVGLSGEFGTRSTVTDNLGQFRFLNVDQGTHTLTVELTGFAGQQRNVVVRTGQNVELTFTLGVADGRHEEGRHLHDRFAR
jgi:iron complex outermembrane receptor protein